MKKIVFILILLLSEVYIYSDTKLFNSVKIYGINQSIIYRNPTTEKNIMERYCWYFECKDVYVDFQYFNKNSLKNSVNVDIGLKMVFEANGTVKILYFARDDIPVILQELNNLLNYFTE